VLTADTFRHNAWSYCVIPSAIGKCRPARLTDISWPAVV